MIAYFNILLISIGLVTILYSLYRILNKVKKGRYLNKTYWLKMMVFCTFFSVGYIGIMAIMYIDHIVALKTILSVVMLLGAVYVLLTVRMTEDLIKKIGTKLKIKTEEFEKSNKEIERQSNEYQELRTKSQNLSKVAALGEMAGGVAHEVANPLTVIKAYSIKLRDDLRNGNFDNKKALNMLKKINSKTDRIMEIIKGLRDFSTNDEITITSTGNLKEIVTSVLDLNEYKILSGSINVKLSLENVSVQCSESQISTVLHSMINNSIESISGLSKKEILISIREDQKNAKISIQDSGSGIPAKVAEKIFEPFFTTKEVGAGTGLGLSVACGIIRSHGGIIRVDSTCPNTRFVITLPKKIDPSKIRYMSLDSFLLASHITIKNGVSGIGTFNGSFGELMQGFLPSGDGFHVTCPINKSSTARVSISESPVLKIHVDGAGSKKTELAVKKTLELLKIKTATVNIFISSDLDVAKGMGSSTANICAAAIAVADAFKVKLSSRELAKIATSIESSDGTMFQGVNAVNHKNGEVIRTIKWCPEYTICALIPETVFNTESANFKGKESYAEEFDDMLDTFCLASEEKDFIKMAELSTQSAVINQKFVPNPLFDNIFYKYRSLGALGLIVGHTGTVCGLIFAPDERGMKLASEAATKLSKDLDSSVKIDVVKINLQT
jgi:uncharacterized protein involved in propanediol utilization/signal transduction histidine kinase